MARGCSRWVALIIAGALMGVVAGAPARGGESVDLELVLLADASRSIDDEEIRFQRQGYAAAITHPEILAAIGLGRLGRIAITYVEWGDEDSQDVVVPWTIVDGARSADRFAEALAGAPRVAYGPNAIGSALAFARDMIETNDIDGLRRVIDISGDSANSFGGLPIQAGRAAALADGIVINGLAVICDYCGGPPVAYDIAAAFRTFITGGPGSFVVVADGKERFARAVRRKLLLEIADRSPREAISLAGSGAVGEQFAVESVIVPD